MVATTRSVDTITAATKMRCIIVRTPHATATRVGEHTFRELLAPGYSLRHFRPSRDSQALPETTYFAAAASSAARSVFSQVNSGSLRPKCPPEAVLR